MDVSFILISKKCKVVDLNVLQTMEILMLKKIIDLKDRFDQV